MTVLNIGITFDIFIFDWTMPDINEIHNMTQWNCNDKKICFIILDLYRLGWACYI